MFAVRGVGLYGYRTDARESAEVDPTSETSNPRGVL